MKKIVAALVILVILAIAASCIFIPAKIKIMAVKKSSMNIKAAYRYLLNEDNWTKWWPGPKVFYYNGTDFRINKKMLTSFEVQLIYKKDTLMNMLQLIPLNADSTAYAWSCKIESSKNPFIRWMQYFNARHIKKNLEVLTDSLKNYLEKEENVYGFKVKIVKVTDSVLVATRSSFDHYPGAEEIGQMVQRLKDYIKKENAVEKNYPMLNVHQLGSGNYEAMAAIATDRKLPATKDFSPKNVLKGGNLLEAEFTGGPFAIKKGLEEFENYKVDLGFISPAIPYQLMITDRVKEKDTTRWLTKFYYPIF
jgi:DNA-directed RNA polymerase subunit L